MLPFFKKFMDASPLAELKVDMHNHLLPGLDDGVDNFDQSVQILKEMQEIGFEKVIITPHIMDEYYKNSNESIRNKLKDLNLILKGLHLSIETEAAGEHYLDEAFLNKLNNKEELLTFGKNYLLFETSYINQPAFLKEAVFKIKSAGLIPVLAHPERYIYMQLNFSLLEELMDMGTLLQININSLSGYYSKAAQKFAEKLIDKQLISFMGSDCHNIRHLEELKKTFKTKYFRKAVCLNLLNNTLL